MEAQGFDGVWCRGEERHFISAGRLTWADGSSSVVAQTGPCTISLSGEEMDGVFSACLSPDGEQLRWNNGSSWARAPPRPAAAAVADRRERTDLKGLLEHLAKLSREGVLTRRVLYIVNDWALGGLISVEHHGFVLELEAGHGFLTLNFGSAGIGWQRCREQPELPEGTKVVKSYGAHLDPGQLWSYCAKTQPFSIFNNDCKAWCTGMMQELRVDRSKGTQLELRRPCGSGYILSCF